MQDTQNYVRNNVMHKSTGGHSTDDSYVRTDEEDAELYDHDPKVGLRNIPKKYSKFKQKFFLE